MMSQAQAPSGEIQSLELPSVVDVDAIDELREWLAGAMEMGEVRLDGSKVTRLATNALLMMASARKTAETKGSSFQVCNPSPAFGEAVERLGMHAIMTPILSRAE